MEPFYFDPQLRRAVEESLLPEIQRPGQYIGGELGQIKKKADSVLSRLAFVFPDTYPIGMSNYAMMLLYSLVNQKKDLACERVFVPFPDMEALLRSKDLPLYSLETFTPLFGFDLVGFTLQYELSYTNVLNALDLGRIPLHCDQRTADMPLIIAGGPAAFNPEPMSSFIDVFQIGDGEQILPDLCHFWGELKEKYRIPRCLESHRGKAGVYDPDRDLTLLEPKNWEQSQKIRREMLLETARKFSNIYVPAFYQVEFDEKGRAKRPRPVVEGIPEFIEPAIIKNLDDYPAPEHPIIPLIESVQDRVSVEIMRGCPQSCRFCQSSPIKRPLRKRSIDQICRSARNAAVNTGTDDVTLLSLSSSEYPGFDELIEKLHQTVCPLGITLAVPSLRVNHQLGDLTAKLSGEKLTSLTIAPEAALEPMRKKIRKLVTDDDLINGCKAAFENGFNRIKMYFMCGFPGETDEDIIGIVHLCDEIVKLGKSITGRYPTVIANVSNFVPKPHTPLQWCAMADRKYFQHAHQLLRSLRRFKSIDVKYHTLETSLLEGLMTRGDRRVGKVIELAWQKGARLDAWTDQFIGRYWDEAIAESGIDPELIAHTPYNLDAELPWDHITTFSGKERLVREYQKSLTGEI